MVIVKKSFKLNDNFIVEKGERIQIISLNEKSSLDRYQSEDEEMEVFDKNG